MIELRATQSADLRAICAMERDSDTAPYILPTTLGQHRLNMARRDTIYLSIHDHGELAGFMVLVLDPDGFSVEFRRIVVADKGAGIGQRAIVEMENYCRESLNRRRVWLDVFDFNPRGMHLYSKLGYRFFGQQDFDGERLLAYEKNLY